MLENPVKFDIEYPEKLSRGILLLKTFLGQIYIGIPHLICLVFYEIAVLFCLIYVFFVVLFTGVYPRGVFEFVKGFIRWTLRVGAYWTMMMTDKYPAFTNKEIPGDPVTFDIEYQENLSRGLLLLKCFFGFIFVGIPHLICLYLYLLAVMLVNIYVFFYILFTGKYPKAVFDFCKGVIRWNIRVTSYWTFMMHDVYPPFTGKE